MSSTSKIKIQFRNPLRQYQPGNEVVGLIKVDIPDDCQVKSIVCCFKGRAEARYGGVNRPRRTYYLDETVTAYDRKGEEFHHLHGCYPFKVTLPANSPPSFSGRLGYITYTIKVTVRLCNRSIPLIEMATFKVLPTPMSVLEYEQLRERVPTPMDHVGMVYGAFRRGSMSLVSTLSTDVIFPNESITLTTQIRNLSSVTLKTASLRLWCKIIYHSYLLSKTDEHDVQKSKPTALNLAPGAAGDFTFSMVASKNLPATVSIDSIQVRYFLSLKVTNSAFLAEPTIFTWPVSAATKPNVEVQELQSGLSGGPSDEVHVPPYPPTYEDAVESGPLDEPPSYSDTFDGVPPSYTEVIELQEQHATCVLV